MTTHTSNASYRAGDENSLKPLNWQRGSLYDLSWAPFQCVIGRVELDRIYGRIFIETTGEQVAQSSWDLQGHNETFTALDIWRLAPQSSRHAPPGGQCEPRRLKQERAASDLQIGGAM